MAGVGDADMALLLGNLFELDFISCELPGFDVAVNKV